MPIDLEQIQAKNKPTTAQEAQTQRLLAEWTAYDTELTDWNNHCLAQGIEGEAFRQGRYAIRSKYKERGIIIPGRFPEEMEQDG